MGMITEQCVEHCPLINLNLQQDLAQKTLLEHCIGPNVFVDKPLDEVSDKDGIYFEVAQIACGALHTERPVVSYDAYMMTDKTIKQLGKELKSNG